MPRAWLAVSASTTAALLALALSIGAAGSSAWAGADGVASGAASSNAGLLRVAPLDAKPGESNVLRVEAVEDLGFGKVVAGGGGGQVVLDPATGRKTARGGAFDLGGYASRAEFIIRGTPNARFAILLPDRVTLSGKGGKVVLRNLTSSPRHFGRIGPNGAARVYVGATLELRRNPPTGTFRGAFSILLDAR
ncbi:MAG: DUF4402 domain-containing protein [Proteobacteria bacterium]|nr:DUF4402 domain-containing protein [Pseudomonadota bacterium]